MPSLYGYPYSYFNNRGVGYTRGIPYHDEAVQFLDGKIIQNDNGWFLEDKLGKETRAIETGDCYSNSLLSGFVTIPNNGESLFGKSIEVETYLNELKASNAIFGYCDNLGARFDIGFERTFLRIFQYNGTTGANYYHCGNLVEGNYYKIKVEWVDSSTPPVIYINDVLYSNLSLEGSIGLRPIEERNITKLFHLSLPTSTRYMGNGKIANLKMFDTNGEIEHFYKCDETVGDVCYDYAANNPINGQIIGADATFHAKDVHFSTDKNKYGYTTNTINGVSGIELTPRMTSEEIDVLLTTENLDFSRGGEGWRISTPPKQLASFENNCLVFDGIPSNERVFSHNSVDLTGLDEVLVKIDLTTSGAYKFVLAIGDIIKHLSGSTSGIKEVRITKAEIDAATYTDEISIILFRDNNVYYTTVFNSISLYKVEHAGTEHRDTVDPLGNPITMKRNKLNCEVRGTNYVQCLGEKAKITCPLSTEQRDAIKNCDQLKLEVWINVDNPSPAEETVITIGRGANLAPLGFAIALKSYGFLIEIHGTENDRQPTKTYNTAFFDGLWHKVSAEYVRNTNKINVYVNDIMINTFGMLPIGILDIGSYNCYVFSNNTTSSYNYSYKGGSFRIEVNNQIMFESTLSEGEGNKLYNKIDGKELPISGDVTSNFWKQSNSNDIRPNNLLDGFDLWTNDTTGKELRVPLKLDKTSIKTQGDTINGYTWVAKVAGGKGFNNSENSMVQPSCPDLVIPDIIQQHYWFNTDTNPNDVMFKDRHAIVYDNDPKYITFMDLAIDQLIRKIVVYDHPMNDGEKLTKIQKSFKDPILRNQDGTPILDSLGEEIESSRGYIQNNVLVDAYGDPILDENGVPITIS